MFDLTFDRDIHLLALDAALRAALGADCIGVSSGGGPIRVHLSTDDPALIAAATALVEAHDPVFLSADQTTVTADGSELVTITVRAPKPGAAAVTLEVGGALIPVTLTDGVGTITIDAVDPGTVEVRVANPDNRSVDRINLQAV